MNNLKNTPGGRPNGVDHAQAAYWNGSLTRIEAQRANEEVAKVIQGLMIRAAQQELAITFLSEKLGVTPEQFQEYTTKKVEEFNAAQAKAAEEANAAGETAPVAPYAEPSLVTLD